GAGAKPSREAEHSAEADREGAGGEVGAAVRDAGDPYRVAVVVHPHLDHDLIFIGERAARRHGGLMESAGSSSALHIEVHRSGRNSRAYRRLVVREVVHTEI